jgi:hypothetical protein
LRDSASILLYFGASQTGGILLYVGDLKRSTNPAKGGRPKDIFEMASNSSLKRLLAFFHFHGVRSHPFEFFHSHIMAILDFFLCLIKPTEFPIFF